MGVRARAVSAATDTSSRRRIVEEFRAGKPERMGKKYQWIAYHEILAYLADHFQYREQYAEDENDQHYQGPWQLHVRDIDPSCTVRGTPGGTGWVGGMVSTLQRQME